MKRWTEAEAWEWYWRAGLQEGFNYIPRNCVNTTELWQSQTFDPIEINWELGLAHSLGFTSVRVFLQYIVWEDDPDMFERRFDTFLTLASGRGLNVVPVLFDDCRFAGSDPFLGSQDNLEASPGNGGWTPSPGHALATDPGRRPALLDYVLAVTATHSRDKRILAWDLYNEPGNSGMGEAALPLLDAAFGAAREVSPSQPLTAGAWRTDTPEDPVGERCVELSDVVSFHTYNPRPQVEGQISRLLLHRRPLFCTEWMARPNNAWVGTLLEIFRRFGVSYYNWGLVNGRTRTHYALGSAEGDPEPEDWAQDLALNDGSAYRSDEWYLLRAAVLGGARPQTAG